MILTKLTLILIAGGAGLGGGLLAQTFGEQPQPFRAEQRGTAAAVGARFDALAHKLEWRIDAFEERLEAAASRPAPPVEKSVAPQPLERAPVAATSRANENPARIRALVLLEELAGKPYTHKRSERIFDHLAAHNDEIETTIAHLKQAIAKDAGNPHLHAALGTALTAKTAFLARGPKQGVFWAEAGKSFAEAIRLDPNHWEARYSLAFGDSMAPEFVGLRPRAIERFEELRKIQESQAQAADHVLVYARLGTLYKDAGNARKARQVWERGRERFPEDKTLTAALELIGKE